MKKPISNKLFDILLSHKQFEVNNSGKTIQKETGEQRENNPNIEPVIEKVRYDEQIEEKIREEEELKFKFAAIIIDRFFLYLALFYAFITFVALIMTNSNLYN